MDDGRGLLAGYWLVLGDAEGRREMFDASPSVEEWGILQLALRERDRVLAFDPHEIVGVIGADVEDWQWVPLDDEPLRVRVKRLVEPADSLLVARLEDPRGGLWDVRFGATAFGEPEVRIDATPQDDPAGPDLSPQTAPAAPQRGVCMPVRTPAEAFDVARRIVIERAWTWAPRAG